MLYIDDRFALLVSFFSFSPEVKRIVLHLSHSNSTDHERTFTDFQVSKIVIMQAPFPLVQRGINFLLPETKNSL